jgi:ATP-dependent DNA helicase RecQ
LLDNQARAAQETLRQAFGFSVFRPHQEEIVDAVLSGRDVFATLPTGGGKSLCYQLPALLFDGLTVVVSPLIALMEDQVTAARQNGLPAAFLNSSLVPADRHAVWASVVTGETRLLYVSPERLAVPDFQDQLSDCNLSLFAVDEAHCISEWGHEFRPDYRNLEGLRARFPSVPIAAFTATATPQVQTDVITLLQLERPLVVRASFDRPELFYTVARKEKPASQILSYVKEKGEQPGIIYRATRKSVDGTTESLRRAGIPAVSYHAGLSDQERQRNQRAFVRDEVQVVVATIAFGMGIDKANVRWILHADLPRSIEAYYQETGRAGRDGDPAEACLLFGGGDIAQIRYHIERMQVEQERERALGSLREMLRYANSGVCRRVQLLAHFHEHHPGSCGGCDVCTGAVQTADHTVAAQKAMSAIVRTGERFGAHHIVDVVAGTQTDRVLSLGHDRLPTFGVGEGKPREWWLALVADLEAAGLVHRRDGSRSGLAISSAGREVLFGRESFHVTEPDPERYRSRGRASRSVAPPADGDLQPEAQALYACLRTLRTRLARSQGVPPYVVFSDKSLRSMATLQPTDHDRFLSVHGVGQTKAERYGSVFLDLIREFLASGECKEA